MVLVGLTGGIGRGYFGYSHIFYNVSTQGGGKMWEVFIELISSIFGGGEKQSTPQKVEVSYKEGSSGNVREEYAGKEIELYHEAEELRKAGHVKEAEKKYWKSIIEGENSEEWKKHGPAPAMYRELAKLYYHTELDEKALGVLDRYMDLTDKNRTDFKTLRERFEKEDFRRLKNKYDEKPTGDYP